MKFESTNQICTVIIFHEYINLITTKYNLLTMSVLKNIIYQNIFEKIDKAGIATPRQILMLSVLDVKKVTNLSTDDIIYLKNVVSNYYKPPCIACDKLEKVQKFMKISCGCTNIDNLLHGGFSAGTITEIYGESGSGKTQLAISTAANSWPNKTVYICTEDLFPVKRLNQIINNTKSGCVSNYGQHIFVEHVTESHELISCIRVRLPKLLEANKVSNVIIDSIAAPFRCEGINYMRRAEDLREVAITLISLAQKHNFAVICINQVTSSFDESMNVLPALGLAWSNMVTYRLWMKKLKEILHGEQLFHRRLQSHIRELTVIFAPDLPNSSTRFIITQSGLQNIP